MTDAVWVLGTSMTPFGRYSDRDAQVDLGADAARAALADGGVTIFDVGVLAVGCLYEPHGAGQPPEADRADRNPGLQRHQRVRVPEPPPSAP